MANEQPGKADTQDPCEGGQAIAAWRRAAMLPLRDGRRLHTSFVRDFCLRAAGDNARLSHP